MLLEVVVGRTGYTYELRVFVLQLVPSSDIASTNWDFDADIVAGQERAVEVAEGLVDAVGTAHERDRKLYDDSEVVAVEVVFDVQTHLDDSIADVGWVEVGWVEVPIVAAALEPGSEHENYSYERPSI